MVSQAWVIYRTDRLGSRTSPVEILGVADVKESWIWTLQTYPDVLWERVDAHKFIGTFEQHDYVCEKWKVVEDD